MTMKRNLFAAILLVAAVAYACTSTEQPMPVEKGFANDGSIVANPTATIANFVYDAPSTKTVLEIDETTGATFTFANDDILGVFPYNPLQGDQVRFTVKVQTADACTFNGSGYALESGQKYAAYYPGDLANAAAEMMTKIPVSYAGQSQAAVDGETFDISAADYLVANGIEPASGVCEFKMSHLGTLLVMDVMPMSSGTFTELSLVADENLFTESGTVDLTQEITVPDDGTPAQGIAIANPVKVNKLTLALGTEGIELDGEQAYRFCMMIAPVDLTGKSAKIVLKGVDGADEYELEAPLNAKNYKQGYAYNIIAVVSEAVAEPVNLSANGTANCYIVSEAGDYYFDASVAGNGAAGVVNFPSDFTGAYPAANTCALSIPADATIWVVLNQGSCISDVTYNASDKTISFKASGAKGNAKIALDTPDGPGADPYWTWHIWCTDEPGTVTYTTGSGNSLTVQDRNLGAITNAPSENLEEMAGLYYQFGNPIGYTRAEFANGRNWADGNMATAFHNPQRPMADNAYAYYWFTPYVSTSSNTLYSLLWTNGTNTYYFPMSQITKTIYDPCPAGYQVAPSDIFNAFTETSNYDGASADKYGIYVAGDVEGAAFFPYNGFVNPYGASNNSVPYGGSGDATIAMWTSRHNARNASWCYTGYHRTDASAHMGLEYEGGNPGKPAFGQGVRCVKDN